MAAKRTIAAKEASKNTRTTPLDKEQANAEGNAARAGKATYNLPERLSGEDSSAIVGAELGYNSLDRKSLHTTSVSEQQVSLLEGRRGWRRGQ
ncbi:MAG: hypothetical protein L6R37_007033 [Teloschistes peruensis]|nr:MAG: hypothetical protein L6R37_007033 [Teloschistes peruensis]